MWLVNKKGKILGPFSDEEMCGRIEQRLVAPLDRVSEDGSTWKFVRDIRLPKSGADVEKHEMAQPPCRPHVDVNLANTMSALPANPPQEPTQARQHPVYDAVDRDGKKRKTWLIILAGAVILFCLSAFVMCDTKKDGGEGVRNGAGGGASETADGKNDGEGATGGNGTAASDQSGATGAESSTGESDDGNADSAGSSESGDKDGAEVADNSGARHGGNGNFDAVRVEQTIVIVESGNKRGTAFLVRESGNTYLVSAESVFRGWDRPVIRNPDGSTVRFSFGAFSVASDRNLARFEVTAAPSALIPAGQLPKADAQIMVCGCDVIHGVAKSKGVVGNVSGSVFGITTSIGKMSIGGPVVDDCGKVFGAVVSCISSKGAGSEAVSLDGVRWIDVDRAAYEKQVGLLVLFKKYHDFLVPFLQIENGNVDDESLMYDGHTDGWDFGSDEYGFNAALDELAKSYERLVDTVFPENATANPEKAKDAYVVFTERRRRAVLLAKSFLDNGVWTAAPHLGKGAAIAGANNDCADRWLEVLRGEEDVLAKIRGEITGNFKMDKLVRIMNGNGVESERR